MAITGMILNKANSTMVYLHRLMVVSLFWRKIANWTFFEVYVI